MIRALFLLLLAGAAALFLVWATQNFTGQVLIPWGDQTVIEVNIVFAVVGLIVAAGLIAILWNFLGGLYNLPQRLARGRKQKAAVRAETALTEGLLAAEAGDTETALKLAKKAMDSTADERLRVLLEARAAESAGRWNEAEAHWARLTAMPGGQLAGLRGAATAAAERGDDKAAEERTRSALHLNTKADWPFHSLFDFQVSRADWSGAIETLVIGKKRKFLDDTHARRRLAVLLTAQAMEKDMANGSKDKASLLSEAVKLAPEFVPAVYHGALAQVRDGRQKNAKTTLESGWKTRPHPGLVQVWQHIDETQKTDTDTIDTLIKANPNHVESRLIEADAALKSENWTQAVAILEALTQNAPTSRMCQMAANAYEGLGRPETAQIWQKLSLTAARDADWSDMAPLGQIFDFESADWSRLVYEFGDRGELVHIRHERFQSALEVPTIAKRLEDNSEGAETPESRQAPKTW